MSEIKTKENNESVEKFIRLIKDNKKQEESFKLLKIFEDATKLKAKMWGTSIIGFGKYHYKSEKSKQEGDWPLTAFSPRKQYLTLYLMNGPDNYKKLLGELGKFKTSSGSCLYINSLDDVKLDVLKKIVALSFKDTKKIKGVN